MKKLKIHDQIIFISCLCVLFGMAMIQFSFLLHYNRSIKTYTELYSEHQYTQNKINNKIKKCKIQFKGVNFLFFLGYIFVLIKGFYPNKYSCTKFIERIK